MSRASTMMIIALSLQIITSFLLITATATSPQGFTADLIHRRSKSSGLSKADAQIQSSPYADTVYDYSVYLMKLQIGTPPVEVELILDTGSSLTWTQCLPCLNCYKQDAPIFDPSKSSSFKDKTCDTSNLPCPYDIIYGDRSYTLGTEATETVTIRSTSGQPYVMAETTIGCGHNNSGFVATAGSGIVGLDWSSSSLITQMGDTILGLFSYCFSGNGTSKINFGANAIVAGNGTVATNMFRKNDKPDFYYLNLDAISVGENRIETLGTSFHASDGNIIIDSGTTYTYLPDTYCNKVKDAVKSVVKADIKPSSDDMLCYYTNDMELFPVITMHFSGGADLVMDKYNIYNNFVGVSCMMLVCADSTQYSIFGNKAQNNWLVGYDTSSQLVSFKSTDCSTLWS